MSNTAIDKKENTAPCQNLDDAFLDLPPCQAACPVGTDIPGYAGLIWDGNLEAAVEAITAANPFSSICGRVCASPCERACKRGENDGAVTVRQLKRFVMDQVGSDYHPAPAAVTRTESIGIVGAGPTGLTAAQDLAEAGYAVDLYEQADRLGGMMNTIPRFRLPVRFIRQDIRRILDHCPGITVHLNTALGRHVTLEDLKRRHEAVLLTIGLCKDRPLKIPGAGPDVKGLHGIALLDRIGRGEEILLDGPVVVVGGGNVAMDMARTALRCGSSRVELYCLESRGQMPAWDHEITQAESEGVVIHNGWGPKEIRTDNGAVTRVVFQRCTSVFDGEGRFNPAYSQETITRPAAALLLAIGQEAANPELESSGIIAGGRVLAANEQGRTGDPRIFAAGDCAYGPSAIVYAMHHGHKAAYYIRAFLEKVADPAPYRPAYRARHVPVAQEPLWEKLPREAADSAGARDKSCSFDECEAPFDREMARRQAGRCLRCDAETGTANYSRRARNLIQVMARTEPDDARRQGAALNALLEPRENPFPPGRPAHIGDVVFLSAALTRLVIDPYREACNTRTLITRTREVVSRNTSGPVVELDQPFFCTGFDEVAGDIRQALGQGLALAGCGYMGRRKLIDEPGAAGNPLTWFQLVADGDSPDPGAQALIGVVGRTFRPLSLQRQHPGQLLGLSVTAAALPRAIPWALEHQFDLLVLDGTSGIDQPWSELHGYPDLTVMRDAIRILRDMNREEEIALINFGGMRSGTDVAKALALNCNASVFGVAVGLAIGGRIDGSTLVFDGAIDPADRRLALANWIKGTAQEVAIIARCTGKTDVHNLEPEDMRSITLSTADALDLPLAAGQAKRERF
ncbi:MAG: FAD-dependent oxidoreductase [Desulfobacterales bacterium]